MDFNLFKQKLEGAFLSALPGVAAQKKMAPRPINLKRFEEDMENPAKPSAVLILLYPIENDIHLALMKRPTYPGVHSGQMSFPGGKKEISDGSLMETALRETEEEIGVVRSNIKIIGQLTDIFIIVSNYKVTPFVGTIDYKPDFTPDPREVEGLLNVNLSLLLNPKNQSIKKMIFGKNEIINSPYYNVQGNVVWGATAMIISELLELIDPILGG